MSTFLDLTGAAALDHWGTLRARGEDAAGFLHGQLTSDFTSVGPADVRLAGFCSAKGRLQASFIAWTSADGDVLLACSRSVLAATLKRLSMFVLRARCKLSDATAEFALRGLVGPAALAAANGLAPWQRRDADGITVIRLPDAAGLARAWRVAPAAAGSPSPTVSLDAWRWLEVQSGLPLIEAATVDAFVPQMLNLELLGGIDFKKGCYPGQEIVARSQYRGTIKRRMFLFDVDAVATAGQEVFHSGDPAQPAGLVVNAAPRPGTDGSSALVEVKLAALGEGSLHLAAPDGPALRQTPLPYALPFEPAEAA
jgi:folate-binding protein YgfZ